MLSEHLFSTMKSVYAMAHNETQNRILDMHILIVRQAGLELVETDRLRKKYNVENVRELNADQLLAHNAEMMQLAAHVERK